MSKERVTDRYAVPIIVIYMIATTYLAVFNSNARQDAWISALISFVIAFPLLIVYGRIVALFPGQNLYNISIILFGKIVGKVVSLLFIAYSFILGSLIVKTSTEGIKITSLYHTPQVVYSILMVVLAIYLVRCGVTAISKWAAILFPLIIGIIIFELSILIPEMNIINVKPVLYNNWIPVLQFGYSMAASPAMEMIIFVSVLCYLQTPRKAFGAMVKGVGIGTIIISLLILTNILIMGVPFYQKLYFPLYTAITTLSTTTFLQGAALLEAVLYYLAGFTKLSVCLFVTVKGFCRVFNIENYKKMAAPIGLLMVGLSTFMFENIHQMVEFYWVLVFWSMPFQLLFPIIIWIFAEVRARKLKGKDSDELEENIEWS